MKGISIELGLLLVAMALFFSACSDPALFGSDLLEEDQLGVETTDTLTLLTTTVAGSPVITSDTTFIQSSYLLGRLEDPFFGLSVSNLYIQPKLEYGSVNFSNSKLDSIVLILPYDSVGLYGQLTEPFGLEVFRLLGDLPSGNLSSDMSFAYEAMPLGQATFVPNLDSIEFNDYALNVKDTVSRSQLRIPLNNSFGEEIMGLDTSFFSTNDAFLTYLRGLLVRPTSEAKAMLGIDLLDSYAGVMLYYTRDDTLNQQFQFYLDLGSVRYSEFQHDVAGTPVEQYLQSELISDSLVFIQGMAGVMGKVEIPHVQNLRGIVVNKAELYVPVASESNVAYPSFPLIERIVLFYRDEDGELVPIDDVQGILARRLDLDATYGGTETYEDFISAYTMNISSHFQKMVEGTVPKELFFSIVDKDRLADRSIVHGATHSRLPMKLKLAYTQL